MATSELMWGFELEWMWVRFVVLCCLTILLNWWQLWSWMWQIVILSGATEAIGSWSVCKWIDKRIARIGIWTGHVWLLCWTWMSAVCCIMVSHSLVELVALCLCKMSIIDVVVEGDLRWQVTVLLLSPIVKAVTAKEFDQSPCVVSFD